MAFGVGDSLRVRVSAATQDFTSGMESASDSLNSVRNAAGTTSGSLQVLQGRANETGDEFERLDRKADATRRGFDRLSVSAMGLSTSLMSLGSITIVSLIPSLLTLATIAAPLIATFGGIAAIVGSVAGAFGFLIATGFVTHWQEIQTEMKQARKEIEAIIEPLGQVFGPLIVQAIDSLPELVEAIVKSIGGVEDFRDALIQMGGFAFEVIPMVTRVMFELARDAIPALLDGLQWLRNNGGAIFRGMMDTTREMLPVLGSLVGAFVDIIPELTTFGTAVAKTVIPTIGDMLELFGKALRRLNALPEPFRQIAISALVLAPALTILTGIIPTLIGGLATVGSVIAGLSAPILAVVAAVGVFAAAWATNFAGVRDLTSEVLGGVMTWFEDLRETVGGVFEWVSGVIDDNSRAFGQFERAVNRALRGVVDFIDNFVAPAMRFVFNKVIMPLVSTIGASIRKHIGPVLSEVAQSMQAVGKYARIAGDILVKAWKSVDQIVIPIINTVVDVVQRLAEFSIGTLARGFKFLMNLIQGDFGEALENLETQWEAVFDIVGDVAGILFSAVKDAFDAVIKWIIGSGEGGGAPSLIQSAMDWLFSTGVSITWDILGAVKSAFVDAANWIVTSGVSVLGKALQAVQQSLGNLFDRPEGGQSPFRIQDNPNTLQIEGLEQSVVPRGPGAGQTVTTQSGETVRIVEPNLKVNVTGDTGVVKDVTVEALNEQNRQVRRQTGTNVSPTNR